MFPKVKNVASVISCFSVVFGSCCVLSKSLQVHVNKNPPQLFSFLLIVSFTLSPFCFCVFLVPCSSFNVLVSSTKSSQLLDLGPPVPDFSPQDCCGMTQ